MAEFIKSEILNEVASLIGGRSAGIRDADLLDPIQAHGRLMDLASVAFLVDRDAIFYLINLATNSLLGVVRREVAVLEDMLVSIDDLSRIGTPITNTTDLSNASTALLGLETAASIKGRNELSRFVRSIDAFSNLLRPNVYSGGRVVRTRESSQLILRDDMLSLVEMHDKMLSGIESLRGIMEEFAGLDLPTMVSSRAFANIRLSLELLRGSLESTASNASQSREALLRVLSSKSVVNLVAGFTDPSSLKYRSPVNPVPEGITHLGRVRGAGVPPSVATLPGPWELPLSDLKLKVGGGSEQTIQLSAIIGASINGRNSEEFSIDSSNRNLNVVVDPQMYELLSTSSGSSGVVSVAGQVLGFRHLGTRVMFSGRSGADGLARMLTDMGQISSGTASGWTPATQQFVASFSPALESGHVGAILEDGTGQQFEVLDVVSGTTAVIDPRGLTPNSSGTAFIKGTNPSTVATSFSFSPVLLVNTVVGEAVNVGPTFKNCLLTTGVSRTAANIVSDINQQSPPNTLSDLPGGSLAWHVRARPVSGDPEKVALEIRGRAAPFLQISGIYLDTDSIAGGEVLVGGSSHTVLGFREGEFDSDTLLSTGELADSINSQVVGVLATVERQITIEGNLSTTRGSSDVTDSSRDFEALGVVEGCGLYILDGDAAGTYRVDSVSGSDLTLRAAPLSSSESGLRYQVVEDRVRVESTSAGRGCSLEITSSPSELGLTDEIQYGSLSEFEAVDRWGAALNFGEAASGDFLKVTGEGEVGIESVAGSTLYLASALPSYVEKAPFSILGSGARQYETLKSSLDTFVDSRNLLSKHGFNESVDYIDASITPAMTQGQMFSSNLAKARTSVADLLGILTSSLSREDEYQASVSQVAHPLDSILAAYFYPPVEALDNLLEYLTDQKYDRALDMLLRGRLSDFFSTDHETSSYAGALARASNDVKGDLPEQGSSADFVEEYELGGVSFEETADADDDLSDTAFEDYEE